MNYFYNLGVRKETTSSKRETFDKFDHFENLNILYGKKRTFCIKSKVKNQNIKTVLNLFVIHLTTKRLISLHKN